MRLDTWDITFSLRFRTLVPPDSSGALLGIVRSNTLDTPLKRHIIGLVTETVSQMEVRMPSHSSGWSTALFTAIGLALTMTVPDSLSAQGTGRIRGRVTDADDKSALPAVQISVVGTSTGAVTGATGQYVITGLNAGPVTLRVRRIGYTSKTQDVVVVAGGEVVADIIMSRAATQLSEVITTATGDVEKKSFGNVVATIKADSLVGKAPITTVNELLQARTAGVQVIQGTGQTGASSSIRIRGASSLSLTNEPLIIVDGIRFDNSPASSNFSSIRVNRFGTLQSR